ncbi:nicotinamide-nucleotide adenylyltransferase 2 [Lineolata rhizophorae]|uniref:Nicotinamide-nucleotide adenylyltransferase n=1 Tax=Lineolata rhizophorae TaxID=578093 RepID=A0A6A6NNK5_9PEZI|nr:nicotinamide-nucleotide adenylyltransferase 2 [Lineolata rhizophorae]
MDATSPPPPQLRSLENYTLPRDRMKRLLSDSSKTPLALVSCGSFSPITYLHLRMPEMAADWARFNTDFEVVGAWLSPVGDAYKKAGLAAAHHRLEMCRRATEGTWVMVDDWEALHEEYQPTANVLDHFAEELNKDGGIETYTGERKKIRVSLLAGADLIQTMSTPGLWSPADLDKILGTYGAFIIEREGTDADEALANLQKWKDNIYFIHQLVKNDVSSTRIRLFLRRDMSVRWLIPQSVIDYIEANGLYKPDEGESGEKGATRAAVTAAEKGEVNKAESSKSAKKGIES